MFVFWKKFEGLCITVYLIIAAVEELLSRGAEYVFLEQFSKDSLEEYFGDHNPDIVQFGYNQHHSYSKAIVLNVWEHT